MTYDDMRQGFNISECTAPIIQCNHARQAQGKTRIHINFARHTLHKTLEFSRDSKEVYISIDCWYIDFSAFFIIYRKFPSLARTYDITNAGIFMR